MNSHVIVSALDTTDWFYKKAETAGIRLSENKIQHLLFLAQIHFALKEGRHLMPSLFVCGRSGFYEPTIRTLLKFGLPLMNKTELTPAANRFLDLIWQKYALKEDKTLDAFIWSLECWKHFYRPEEETIVDPLDCVDSFAGALQKNPAEQTEKSKILISQNGPVKVSAWHPRKLDISKNKEKKQNA